MREWGENPHLADKMMVDIAQLVRAPGCGPGGRGFESHYSPHNEIKDLHKGVSPSGKATDFDSVIRWFKSSYPCQLNTQSNLGVEMTH